MTDKELAAGLRGWIRQRLGDLPSVAEIHGLTSQLGEVADQAEWVVESDSEGEKAVAMQALDHDIRNLCKYICGEEDPAPPALGGDE